MTQLRQLQLTGYRFYESWVLKRQTDRWIWRWKKFTEKDEEDTDRRWIWYGRYRRKEERESSLWLKGQSSTHENQSHYCQPMWYCSFSISRYLDDKRWQADRESSINNRRKMLFCCKRTNVKRESRIRVLVLLHCLDFWDAWKARESERWHTQHDDRQ